MNKYDQISVKIGRRVGSTGAYFRWSGGHCMHSFVKCLFWDMPTIFCIEFGSCLTDRTKIQLAHISGWNCRRSCRNWATLMVIVDDDDDDGDMFLYKTDLWLIDSIMIAYIFYSFLQLYAVNKGILLQLTENHLLYDIPLK